MSKPEIIKVEPDVFDPAGGDRMIVHGHNFGSATGVRVGVTQATIVSEPMIGVPDFDGINDRLTTYGTHASTYLPGTGFAFDILFYVRNNPVNAGSINNTMIFGDAGNANIQLDYYAGYVQMIMYVTGLGFAPILMPATSNNYHIVQVWHDGTDLHMSVDGIEGTPVTGASLTWYATYSPSFDLAVGKGFAAGYMNGIVPEIITHTAISSPSDRTNIISYMNKRYGLSIGGILPTTFNPATLSLSGWWRSGNYTAGVWAGTASAGSSGGRNLSESPNYPSVADSTVLICTSPAKSAGTAITAAPNFDGTNDKLAGTTVSNLLGSTGWSVSYLVNIYTLSADAGFSYNPSLFNSSDYWYGLEVFTNTIRLWQFQDNGSFKTTITATGLSVGWNVLQARWTGTSLEVRINNGTWSTDAITSSGGLADTIKIGTNFNGASGFFDGIMADVLFTNSSLSDTQFDNIIGYINNRYRMTIGGIADNSFNPATLSLTGWWRSGNYVSGTWTGTASAGASGSRDLTEATNPPSVYNGNITPIYYPISVRTAAGQGCLSSAVQYANPGTVPDCVWWLRPDDTDVDVNGSTEVTVWRDKSGIGDVNRNVIPTADTPAWNSSDITYGGRPTVGPFTQYNSIRLLSGVWSENYANFTLGIIGNALNSGNRYFTFGGEVNNCVLLNEGGSPAVYSQSWAKHITAVGDLSLSRSFFVVIFDTGASASKLYIESTLPVSDDTGTHSLGSTVMTVGSYAAASITYGVDRLAEVYAYSRPLTMREIRTIRKYRDSYYGKSL